MKINLIKVVIILVLLLLFSFTATLAENSNVEIQLTVGEDTILINGTTIQIEKPFVKEGTTLVPLRVISEAFGAKVSWNSNEESITIKLEDKKIKLYINNTVALIDEIKVNMLQAPTIIGETTMVPLRFISENLGAKVSYDENTEHITVNKGIETAAISDFSTYLTDNSEFIGDSYYQWSMEKLDDTELVYRSFNGKENSIVAKDNSYQIDITINPLPENTNIDSVYNSLITDAKGFTIINKEKKKGENCDYAEIAYRDGNYTFNEVVFIRGNTIFYTCLYSDNEAYDPDLISSFKPLYYESKSINDLSDINDLGLRLYENKELDWNIELFPEWSIIHDSFNKIIFSNKDILYSSFEQELLVVNITSKEENMTLDRWKQQLINIYKNHYNQEYIKLLSVNKKTINGKECYELLCSVTSNNKISYSKEYLFIEEDYKYNICFNLTDDTYNNKEYNTQVKNIINSFECTTLNKESTGEIIDYHLLTYNSKISYRKIISSAYNYSINIPELWCEIEETDNTYKHFYQQDNLFNLTINVIENQDLKHIINQYDEDFIKSLELDNMLIEKNVEKIDTRNTESYAYTLKVSLEDKNVISKVYFIEKNDIVYVLTFSYNEIIDSENTKNIIEEMWKSFNFEK